MKETETARESIMDFRAVLYKKFRSLIDSDFYIAFHLSRRGCI